MSSILLEEVPMWAQIAVVLALVLPPGLIVADMVRKHKADNVCNLTAAEWERATSQGELFRQNEAEHFATLYRSYKLACPKGHDLINEDAIPAAVKTGYVPKQK